MSIVAFFSSKVWIATADRRVGRWQGETGQALRELQCRLDALASEVHEMEPQAAVTILPAVPRPGMNLSKRSQALRMHRRGETPDQIAHALELPLQEVELLLKVHRIVISSI